jgi:two-component system cell cycle response regulator
VVKPQKEYSYDGPHLDCRHNSYKQDCSEGENACRQFAVDACASRQEAEEIIAKRRPDLMLINLSDQIEDRHGFCRELKDNPDTSSIAIISVGIDDTARARFAALDAGADDVLPRPIDDALLLARIRSLLRVRHARQELMLRDGTSRALGFEEARSDFKKEGRVALVSNATSSRNAIAARLAFW